MMRDYSEKRDFRRMSIEAHIKIQRDDDAGGEWLGTCKDLSSTGMQVCIGQTLPIDTLVYTFIPAGMAGPTPFETHAKVVRHETNEEGQILLGLEILKIIS